MKAETEDKNMLKVILADNQAIFRAGAAKVLAVEDDLRVVAQADSPEKLKTALTSFRAGVLIFAEGLQSNLTEVVESAKKQKTHVIVVAESPDSVSRLLQLGVQGINM